MGKIKHILFVLLFALNIYADDFIKLSNEKLDLLQTAYDIGNIVKADDGMSFGQTLASVMITESSVVLGTIGDKFKENGKLKPLKDSSLGAFQIKVPTAKRVITENPILLKNYSNLLLPKNENLLIDKLLGNVKFSALIAAYYLKMGYEEAISRGMSNPYFRAVSRYNGGWSNEPYFNGVKENLKTIRKLINNGKLN